MNLHLFLLWLKQRTTHIFAELIECMKKPSLWGEGSVWISPDQRFTKTSLNSIKHPSEDKVKTSEFGLADILQGLLLATTSNFQRKWHQFCCSVTFYSIKWRFQAAEIQKYWEDLCNVKRQRSKTQFVCAEKQMKPPEKMERHLLCSGPAVTKAALGTRVH